MSAFREANIIGKKTQVIVPENPEAAPITDYGIYLDSVQEVEDEFRQLQDAFFAIPTDDSRILKAAKDWEKCGAILAGYAGSLFNIDKYNTELREYAQRLFDMITKASGLRKNNISQYRKLMMAKPDLNETEKDKITKAKYAADSALIRAVNTQARYRDLFEKGEILNNSQLKRDIAVSIDAQRYREQIPDDVIHMPGRIYPPIPIPPGERVPEPPLAYQMEKDAPLEDKIYDRELDEFVLKPGYVSPDGLIDDKSVIRDRAKGEVIMQLRGGEPVVWKEWKARGVWDVPEPDSWFAEYYIRLWNQGEEDRITRIFEPWPYEQDVPEYDQVKEKT